MTKSQMKEAAEKRWRVVDDFGAIGTVSGVKGDTHVLVQWDGENKPVAVHHARAEPC